MNIDDWRLLMICRHSKKYKDKIKQFNLIPLLSDRADLSMFIHTIMCLRRLDIWALQNPTRFLRRVCEKKKFYVLVGFASSRFHLGHITLARELAWYLNQGAEVVFIVSGYGSNVSLSFNEAKEKVLRLWRIIENINKDKIENPRYIYLDKECLDIRLFSDNILNCISVRKILQIYGWEDNISVGNVYATMMNVAAFLFCSSLLPDMPVIIPLDINQATHVEVAKIVAKKMKLLMPTFSYRMLLPSIVGIQQRMSVKNKKTAIFLDENIATIKDKLIKCFSGGRSSIIEQQKSGGDLSICSFFRIAELFLSSETITNMLNQCINGQVLCRECKLSYVELIMDNLQNWLK